MPHIQEDTVVATVEAPMVETLTVEMPMVEMHTVTMAMHIPAALVLQLAVTSTEIQLTVVLAVLADSAVTAELAAAAATPSKINTQPKTINKI
jgi:hypothetical protein